jgi:putative ABC transport system permease protein
MPIPLSYNLRNLAVRRTTTIMTALGIALTVAVLLAVLALVRGLRTAFEASGNPLHVLVLRKGSDSELVSNFSRTMYQDVKFKPGIAVGQTGEPRISLEMVTVINLVRAGTEDGVNVTLRGLAPVGVEMREGLQLVSGRWFETGKREVVVGQSIEQRIGEARLGSTLRFGRGDWTVVGVFSAGRSALDSEILADLNQVSSDYNRSEVLSSALIEAAGEEAVDTLINDLNNDRRLNVSALRETEYYANQTVSAAPVQYLGMFVSIIMAVGSSFAAMNTMYAAVARRAREIGTLRVLGFSRPSVLLSFVLEALLLSLLGGLIGCLLVLPLNGLTTGIGNFVTFSEISFDYQISPAIIATGLGFALIMGVVGGLFPALMAARKQILLALRDI